MSSGPCWHRYSVQSTPLLRWHEGLRYLQLLWRLLEAHSSSASTIFVFHSSSGGWNFHSLLGGSGCHSLWPWMTARGTTFSLPPQAKLHSGDVWCVPIASQKAPWLWQMQANSAWRWDFLQIGNWCLKEKGNCTDFLLELVVTSRNRSNAMQMVGKKNSELVFVG